jgi:Cu2+-exporting ATPase
LPEKNIESAEQHSGVTADVNLENNTATITSDHEIGLSALNDALAEIGKYRLEDPDNPEKTL